MMLFCRDCEFSASSRRTSQVWKRNHVRQNRAHLQHQNFGDSNSPRGGSDRTVSGTDWRDDLQHEVPTGGHHWRYFLQQVRGDNGATDGPSEAQAHGVCRGLPHGRQVWPLTNLFQTAFFQTWIPRTLLAR